MNATSEVSLGSPELMIGYTYFLRAMDLSSSMRVNGCRLSGYMGLGTSTLMKNHLRRGSSR